MKLHKIVIRLVGKQHILVLGGKQHILVPGGKTKIGKQLDMARLE